MKFDPKYTITPEITQALLEIERHKEAINILPITSDLIASLRETARLMSTHYSTQIEGNVLSPREVKEVIQENKGGFPGRERDEREVRNYFRALEYVESQIKEGTALSEKLIRTIHSLVLIGSKKLTPYREGQNFIKDSITRKIVYMPPEAKDVATMMKSLVSWTKKTMKEQKIPAPIIAGLVHYQFATIHPYYDGNGRTARLLTTFVLHKTGYGLKGIYSLEEYYAKNLQGYYQALDVGTGHNYYFGRAEADITPFLNYFAGGMAISFSRVRLQAERQDEQSPENTEQLRELSPQQRQVLSLFKRSKEVNIHRIAEHLGISQRSAHDLVKKWMTKAFIQVINPSRRARSYGLTEKWENIILSRTEQKGRDQNEMDMGR